MKMKHLQNDLIGFLKSSKYRFKVLFYLYKNELAIPMDISKRMKIHISQVSRTLSELEKRGVVECTTPDRKKGRIYRSTDKGNSILRIITKESD